MNFVTTRHTRITAMLVLGLILCMHSRHGDAQIRTMDIEPNPPGADVTILGPAPRSHLGGSGNPDSLTDINHSQTLVFGDFNGDGMQDLAIGAPDAVLQVGGTQRMGAGAVYIILGRKDMPSVIDTAVGGVGGADLTILGGADGDRFGFALASGDVNGDGIADLVVGAPGTDSAARMDAGAAFIFFGSHSFTNVSTIDLTGDNLAAVTIYGAGDRFGAAIATGDAGGPNNQAQSSDILIGAPGLGGGSAGTAYLIYGRGDFGAATRVIDLSSGAADFTLRGADRQHLGAAVGIGDFNGDKAGDIFAGAPGASRPDRNDFTGVSLAPISATGAVFCASGPFSAGGSISATELVQLTSFYGAASNHLFGTALAVEDITGDSIDDLIVGAPGVSGDWTDPSTGAVYHLGAFSGAAYVFSGNSSAVQQRFDAAISEQLTTYLGENRGWLGFAVGAGNYNVPGNADTIPDLLIGSPGGVRDTSKNVGGIGGVSVVFGGSTLGDAKTRPRSPLNPAPNIESVSVLNPPLTRSVDFGFTVVAGDFNADSSGDLLTSLPFADAAGRQQAGLLQVRFGTVKVNPPGGGDPGAQPVVRVLSPGGGDKFLAGQQVVISWDASGRDKISRFDVLLSVDGGISFSTRIAMALSPNQSSFIWTVPDICEGNVFLQVDASTVTGNHVFAATDGGFSIALRGPGVDFNKSTIGDSILLVAASGKLFSSGTALEISRDEAGTSYAGFTRPPKRKGGGRKLKTRGSIDGRSLDEYFPDGATRFFRISSSCAITVAKVRRNGNHFQLVGSED